MTRHTARHLRLLAWSALALAGGPVWSAELSPAAQQYIALRANHQAIVDVPAAVLRSQLNQLAGQVVEVAGSISGVMSRQGATIEGRKAVTFMLKPEDGSPSVFVDCAAGTAGVQSGNRVRILTRLASQNPTLSRVALLAVVGETDLPESWRRPTTPSASLSPAPTGSAANPAPAATAPTGPPGIVAPSEIVLAGPGSPLETAANRALDMGPTSAPTVASDDLIEQYKGWVGAVNAKLTEHQRDLIVRSVFTYAHQFSLNHNLVFAMLRWESSFNPQAVSHSGAQGLGQLMPGTAAALGVSNPFDIVDNIRGSVQYLADQMDRYADRPNQERFCLGMACYNAGPNAVARAGHKVPNIAETRQYINRVAKLFSELDAGFR